MALVRTLLCVPSVAKTVEEMAGDMAAAAAMGADVVELRLDYLSSFQPRSDLQRLLTNRPLPVLVTYRSLSLSFSLSISNFVCITFALLDFQDASETNCNILLTVPVYLTARLNCSVI